MEVPSCCEQTIFYPPSQIPIKGCREVRFSNGGHLFAAAYGAQVQVYKTYSCEMYAQFGSVSTGRVKCIAWSADDSHIVTGYGTADTT